MGGGAGDADGPQEGSRSPRGLVPRDENSALRLDYQLSQCVNFWIGSRYAGLKSSRCEYATGIIAACCTSA